MFKILQRRLISMANQVLGVQDIQNSRLVKQMCHFSGKFRRMVQEVCDIEKEIIRNNLDDILSVSARNKALKIEKLQLKRRIQFQMNSFISNPDTWKKAHGDSHLNDTIISSSNGNGKNQNQTNQSKRSRQCRKRNVGKAANRWKKRNKKLLK